MMKKITFLLLAFFSFVNVNAQLWTINSCSNLGSSTYGPMYSIATANATNRTAVIYPSSQLVGVSGQELTNMYFQRTTASGTMAGTPNFKIYLKEVVATDWGTGSLDWATEIATATLVYDSDPASIVGSTNGWKAFPLTGTFIYSGTNNLAVFMEYSNTTASTAITWNYEYTNPCIATTNNNTTKYINNTSGTPGASLTSTNYRRPLIGFDYPVTCPSPTGFNVTNILSTQAELFWTDTASNWNIEYGPSGFALGTGTTISTSSNPHILNTLTANTSYDVYVQTDCGGGDTSVWVGPVSFTTFCNAFTAPWTYDVESAGPTTNSSIGDCWVSNPTGTTSAFRWDVDASASTPTANTGPSGANSGFNYFYTESTSGAVGAVAELTSPLVDVSGLADPSLQFYYHMYGATTGELHVDIFDGASWNNDMVVIIGEQQPTTDSPWNQSVVSLSSLTITGNVQVRFRGIRGSGGTGDISIDDISFDEAPSCFSPTSLGVSNVSSNSFDLMFSDASGGNQFDFYYVIQPQGTGTPASLTGNYEDGTNFINATDIVIPGITCMDLSNCGTTGLTPVTSYEVYVGADCDGDSNVEEWIGPISFTTTCAVYSVPSLEDFTTYVPTCWEEADNGDLTAGPATYGTSNWIADGFGNSGTTGSARYNIFTATANDWLLSPMYDIPATGYELKFKAAATDFGQTVLTDPWESDDFVEVLVSTGTTNWTVLFTYNDTNVPSASGSVNIIDLDAYAGQQVRFAFRVVEGAVNGTSDIDFFIDDFEIRMTPSCPEPILLSVSNVTDTQAEVSWVNGASNWNIEYGPTGFVQGTGTVVSTGTNPTTIGPLSSQTDYDVYVQADCGGGDLSVWVGPVSFTTLCSAVVAPWTYDVESAANTTNSSIGDCWSSTPTGTGSLYRWDVDGAGSTPSTNTGPTGAYSGVKYFYTEASSGSTGAVAELYTPNVDINALTNPTLQFYYHMYGATMGELHVDVFDGSVWTNDVDVIVGQQQTAQADPWALRVVNLAGYTGTIQVRFRGIRGTDFYGDISLDDITFDEAPTCFDPINVAVTNISPTTFDLEWVDASGGNQFDYFYVVQPQGTGTGGTLVENDYDISSGVPFTVTCTDNTDCANTLLTPNTDYEVYVRADCSSNWVGPINFSTSCNPYTIPYFEGFESGYTHNVDVDGCLSQETITGTQVWTANNTFTTYNRTPRTGAWNAFLRYSNEDWLFIPIDLVGGTDYTVELYARQDGATAANSNIAISYGTTNTSAGMTNVIVPATGIINGNYQQITGNFVPATTGTYYVGIKGYMNGSPWYISLDDISIDVTPACPAPSALVVNNLTSSSADISWNATTGNYEYVLDNNPADPAGSGTAIAGETYNATPLTPNTTYYFHVRSDCGSTWSTISFTTPPAPPVNDNLCNPIALTIGAPATGTDYTLEGATAETNEPVPTCFNGGINGGSVWFTFVAPSTSVEVTTDFTGGTLEDGDTEIAVYDATGVNCSDLNTLGTPVGCDQDGGTIVNYASYLQLTTLTPGTTYYIQVDMYGGITTGSFGIQVNDLLSTNNFNVNEFVAYPNPVKDLLTLEYSSDITSVRVVNMLGQEVLAKTINSTSTQVDMSQLAAGTYLVNVTSGNVKKTIKVVKQ